MYEMVRNRTDYSEIASFLNFKKKISLPYPTIYTNSGMFMTTNVKCQHFFMHEKYQLQKHLAFYLKYSVAMQLFCIYAVTHFWFYFVLTYYLLIIFLTFYGYFSNFANLLDNGTSWMKWNCNFRLLRQKKMYNTIKDYTYIYQKIVKNKDYYLHYFFLRICV